MKSPERAIAPGVSAGGPAVARPRTALIVAGMHRSGTSALTRVLNLLGCDVARDIMAPDQHNKRGYWETLAISDLNDRILAAAGLAWDSWESLGAGWQASPAAAGFRQQAAAAIEAQYGGSDLFVMKDPRLCRLLPFWTGVLDELGIATRVILAVRSPAEVAGSLRRRNATVPGIGQLVWLRYVLDAEAASRHLPRACVAYDDLLRDWQGAVARIAADLGGFTWPRSPEAAMQEVAGFLTPELRTQDAREGIEGIADLAPWVGDAWAVLARWAAGEVRATDLEALDAIRAAFDAAEPAFAGVLRDQRHQSERLTASYTALEAEYFRVRDDAERAEELALEAAQAAARITTLEAALAAAHEQRRSAELLLAEAGRVIDRQGAEHDGLARGFASLAALVAAAPVPAAG